MGGNYEEKKNQRLDLVYWIHDTADYNSGVVVYERNKMGVLFNLKGPLPFCPRKNYTFYNREKDMEVSDTKL